MAKDGVLTDEFGIPDLGDDVRGEIWLGPLGG
jgi:hypothetical protein